jgi:hypothetical protein
LKKGDQVLGSGVVVASDLKKYQNWSNQIIPLNYWVQWLLSLTKSFKHIHSGFSKISNPTWDIC